MHYGITAPTTTTTITMITSTIVDKEDILEWQFKAEVELITTLGQSFTGVRLT